MIIPYVSKMLYDFNYIISLLNFKQSYKESKAGTIIIFYWEETKAQRFLPKSKS